MKRSLFIIILLLAASLYEFSCKNKPGSQPSGSSPDSSRADKTINEKGPPFPVTEDKPGEGVAPSPPVSTPDSVRSHPTPPIGLPDDKQTNSGNVAKRSAVFGYSFFKNIKQHETRNINAYVSILNQVSTVINTLKDINATEIPERSNDTATIMTRNIFVFKALSIQLLNAGDSDFIIKPFSESRQIIDSANGNSWTWSVTPRTDKLHGRLIMNVVAEKQDGSREPFNIINIPITIIIDKALDRTLWQWMMDNPEKVITIILIPFIVFFWKQIAGLFKKKEK
jgi:hypothetical protein